MRFGLDITAADVKAEAERRILARYPLWKQINMLRTNGVEAGEMGRFVDAMRAASNQIEAMQPIPTDYRDDRYWQ